jgi:hypothetical protein
LKWRTIAPLFANLLGYWGFWNCDWRKLCSWLFEEWENLGSDLDFNSYRKFYTLSDLTRRICETVSDKNNYQQVKLIAWIAETNGPVFGGLILRYHCFIFLMALS